MIRHQGCDLGVFQSPIANGGYCLIPCTYTVIQAVLLKYSYVMHAVLFLHAMSETKHEPLV